MIVSHIISRTLLFMYSLFIEFSYRSGGKLDKNPIYIFAKDVFCHFSYINICLLLIYKFTLNFLLEWMGKHDFIHDF